MPSQDMVLGCYYLTANNPSSQQGANHYFADLNDALIAYEQNQIDLHAYIWVRFDGKIDDQDDCGPKLLSDTTDQSIYKLFSNKIIKLSFTGEQVVQYIRTTAGRILFNKVIQEALSD